MQTRSAVRGTYGRRLCKSRQAGLAQRPSPHLRQLGLESLEDRRLLAAAPFPAPLEAIDPLGSLIYGSSLAEDVGSAGEIDDLTVDLDADPGKWGQTITVVVDPGPTLQPAIELFDPNGTSIGSITAAAVGEDAVLQVVPTTDAGRYTVRVTGASSTTGGYLAQLTLNAAVEEEAHGGPANDDPASAEDLDGGFITIGSAAGQLGSVLGTAEGSEDWYRFTLDDGQSASLALDATPSESVALDLYDGARQRLATAIATPHLDHAISDFRDGTSDGNPDVYFARVATFSEADYTLVISRQASFDVQRLGWPIEGQLLQATETAVGHLRGPASADEAPADEAPAGKAATPDVAIPEDAEYAPGSVIVRFAEGAKAAGRTKAIHSVGGKLARELKLIEGGVVELADPQADVPAALAALSAHPAILYAEPDYLVETLDLFPNDPLFPELWGMHNTGQTGGTPDADIDAPEAWGLFTGSSEVVVASIDTGVDYTHPDLAAHMWTNPGEIPDDDIDNDGNGYVDDFYGIDTAYNDSNPMDDNSHGTHTSGTIGAVGNDGVGVVGVNWNVQIMALKSFWNMGWGSTSASIQCIDYMTMMKTDYGVNVVASNASWGGSSYSQATKDAIQASNEAGIMFVAAAGNSMADNDVDPHYPSSYDLEGIISVAATDHNDDIAEFSCYGATSVDLGAPGVDVVSTVVPAVTEQSYGTASGTSMATPHVTGTVAMLMAYDPDATLARVKRTILASVDPLPSLEGVTVTGGRLNLASAVRGIGDRSHYRVSVQAGDILQIETGTPSDGPYEFVNRLDPTLQLFDPDSTLVAEDEDSAPDGRNAVLTHQVAVTGLYTVRVSAYGHSSGEYVLKVTGQTGALPPFQVLAIDPRDGGARRFGEPIAVTVDFTDPMLLTSLEASDLTVDGTPATSVTAVDGDTAVFELPAGLSMGPHNLAVEAGAIVDLQGTPVPSLATVFHIAQSPLIVTTTDDEADYDYGSESLSLREGLALAAELGGEDTIMFDDGLLGGTITLDPDLGQLDVNSDVTIEGPGADRLTIDAAGGSRKLAVAHDLGTRRVFKVTDDATATFSGLTITGGNAEIGAGIYNRGTTTVIDSTVSGNVASFGRDYHSLAFGSGVYNDGTMSLLGCTISDNAASSIAGGDARGTGVYNHGTMTISDTTISGNTVSHAAADAWGTGLYNDGTITISDSIISDNMISGTLREVRGAGLCNNGTMTILRSTISDNTVNSRHGSREITGGGVCNRGTMTIAETAISGNRVILRQESAEMRGAGLYNEGDLTITDSTICDNTFSVTSTVSRGTSSLGVGVHNDGTMTIAETTISGNTLSGNLADVRGIGVCSLGTITITDSSISDNAMSATFVGRALALEGIHGGGIYAEGTAAISASTISGNSLDVLCPKDNVLTFGGGIDNHAVMTIDNTTISGNRLTVEALDADAYVRGGGIHSKGNLTIVNSAIFDCSASVVAAAGVASPRGGGIFHGWNARTLLHNTIVAGNDAARSGKDIEGPFDADSSYNLIGVIDDSTGLDGNGTLHGSLASPLDPRLGPLADNGGPTLTHALLPDSPAVDAGNNYRAIQAGLSRDQRGFDRIVDGDGDRRATVDVGPVELVPTVPSQVVGRYVFYNNSAFDGNDPAANPQDDEAIATDKTALLPGGTATFANYTSYSRGINGIMVDVAGLPEGVVPTAADFEFHVGNDDTPSDWDLAPVPDGVTLRAGAGTNASDRIAIIWPDNAVAKQWLQVTVLANGNTGLAGPDVFYFGNAVGETGNSATDAKVDAVDMLAARDNQRGFLDPAPLDFDFDFNRDAKVDATDMLIARTHRTHFLDALKLIAVAPKTTASAGKVANGTSRLRATALGKLDWLYDFDLAGSAKEPSKKPSEAGRGPSLHTSEP